MTDFESQSNPVNSAQNINKDVLLSILSQFLDGPDDPIPADALKAALMPLAGNASENDLKYVRQLDALLSTDMNEINNPDVQKEEADAKN